MMVGEGRSCVDGYFEPQRLSQSFECERAAFGFRSGCVRDHVVKFLVVKGSAGLASLRVAAVVQRKMYYDR